MTKKLIGIFSLVILMLFMSISNCFAYSDDLFEFDLPSSYVNMSYQTMRMFSDSDNSDRGLVIYANPNSMIKKSVWDIDEDDLEDLVDSLAYNSTVISTDRKAKLGEEKAVEVIVSDDGDYIDLFILASNKYIYMVTFVGNSQSDLNNSDYAMIKNSFKLKDHTTNFRAIYIIGIIAIAGISLFFRLRKSRGSSNYNNYNNYDSMDYKNMTEDDFNKLNR